MSNVESRFYNAGGSDMGVFAPPGDNRVDLDKAKKVLEDKLDPNWIKQRDTGFGKKLDYIEGARVIEILNRAFNYKWSFEIIAAEIVQAEPWINKRAGNKEEPQGKYAQVLGKLTVPGLGVKMAFGSKAIIGKVSEQESVFKAAMTDALKKCATMFGVGKELYLEDEESAGHAPSTNWNNASPVVTPQDAPSWDTKDVKRLKELKAVLGIEDNEKLEPLIKDWSKGSLSKATDINPENIKSFIKYLESKVN